MKETYGFLFCGFDSVGMGVFTVVDSRLSGRDSGGGSYEGTVSLDPDTGAITAVMRVFSPRGLDRAAVFSPMEVDATRDPVTINFPPRFGDGAPITVHLPPGPVVVIIKRISDDHAPLSRGFVLSPIAPAENAAAASR